MMIAQALVNAIVQLLLFSIIPFIWWFFTARKKEKFLSWIGLKLPKFQSNMKALLISLLSFVLLIIPVIPLIFAIEDKSVLANARFAGLGFSGIVPVLIYAVIQTGLTEEILFRGLLNKRLSSKFGFAVGNSIHAILFGFIHGALLYGSVGASIVILTVSFTAMVGWLMGYLNEKIGNGSIIPSWTVHSLMNIVSSLLFLFNIIIV